MSLNQLIKVRFITSILKQKTEMYITVKLLIRTIYISTDESANNLEIYREIPEHVYQ